MPVSSFFSLAHVLDGQIVGGSDSEAVFFRVAKQAQIDGKLKDTKISVETSADVEATFANSGVVAQLSARYGKSASCGVFVVQFPAGAKEIVYDPTMGSGEDPFEESQRTGLIVGITLGCVIVVVIVTVAVVAWYRKRAAYQSL